jgi:hypothetical protein
MNWPKRKRGDHSPFTQAELEAIWRPHPGFIGPVGPPMVLWLANREAQAKWRKRVSLTTE